MRGKEIVACYPGDRRRSSQNLPNGVIRLFEVFSKTTLLAIFGNEVLKTIWCGFSPFWTGKPRVNNVVEVLLDEGKIVDDLRATPIRPLCFISQVLKLQLNSLEQVQLLTAISRWQASKAPPSCFCITISNSKAKREVFPFTSVTDQLRDDSDHARQAEELQSDLGGFPGNEGPKAVTFRRHSRQTARSATEARTRRETITLRAIRLSFIS